MRREKDSETTKRWLSKLRSTGQRVTAPRRAVVGVIAGSDHILSATEVFELARQKYPKMGLVTVYRTLESLEALGLVQRVHHPDGCQTFAAAREGHYHLMICNSCGRVAYFSGDDLDALVDQVAGESGYLVQEHWLQLFGICASCQ